MTSPLRLGVNIDHVATIRNARGGDHPDPARAARLAERAGADGITFHLREDRRHILDDDLARIEAATSLPINMEMAPVADMVAIALGSAARTVTLVPEKRAERTTEGGLDILEGELALAAMIGRLKAGGLVVSLFIEPDGEQLAAAGRVGADICEFHTGRYVHLWYGGDEAGAAREQERIATMAARAVAAGIEAHAGHGLTYDTIRPIAAIAEVSEVNIGHFLIGEAVFDGLEAAIARMRTAMDAGRR